MGVIDPAQLAHRVHVAAKGVFTDLLRAHPDQAFYAFGLWTDDSLQFLHPMANTEASLSETVQGYQQTVDPKYGIVSSHDSLRWSYGDWGFASCDEAGHFDEINRLLSENFDRMVETEDEDEDEDEDDTLFVDEINRLTDAVATGLYRLDKEGLFGAGKARGKVTLMLVGDLASELIEASVKVLNPPAVYVRYKSSKARHELATAPYGG